MKAEITLTAEEWETLFKILKSRHAFYASKVQRAKKFDRFNPRGSFNRMLQLVTSILLKLERETGKTILGN
tara:strand:+ start:250 stop:462 length:213 start_codon:yes stop_codon:yes gene_type:complete